VLRSALGDHGSAANATALAIRPAVVVALSRHLDAITQRRRSHVGAIAARQHGHCWGAAHVAEQRIWFIFLANSIDAISNA
jgi:hypothetical protein